MNTQINTQTNKNTDVSLDDFLAEFDEVLPPPSEEEIAQQERREREIHEKVLAISKKYNISEERINELSCMIYNVVGYMHSLCSSKKICVVEKKWGYKDSSVVFGFIVNIRKCSDVTKNEIIIELMYEYEKIALFKIDLDNPIISKAFRERFNDIFVLRNTVGSNLVVLCLCNKKLKNGEVFSTVKNIILFTDDEMNTLFSMNDFIFDDDFIRMGKEIFRANKWAQERIARIKEAKKLK